MKPQIETTPESNMSKDSSPTQPTIYLGWLLAGCLALILIWVGQLYFTAQTEKAILLQQQELTNTTLRSLQNQLEAERILSNHKLHNAEKEFQELKLKPQD